MVYETNFSLRIVFCRNKDKKMDLNGTKRSSCLFQVNEKTFCHRCGGDPFFQSGGVWWWCCWQLVKKENSCLIVSQNDWRGTKEGLLWSSFLNHNSRLSWPRKWKNKTRGNIKYQKIIISVFKYFSHSNGNELRWGILFFVSMFDSKHNGRNMFHFWKGMHSIQDVNSPNSWYSVDFVSWRFVKFRSSLEYFSNKFSENKKGHHVHIFIKVENENETNGIIEFINLVRWKFFIFYQKYWIREDVEENGK